MRAKASGFAVVVALASVSAGSAIAASCDIRPDKAAFHVHALQTELMVAALTCDARPQYNNFAKKFQNTLVDHGHALRQLFRLSHGAGAEKALNSYVTTLANRASQRSISKRSHYCERTLRTFIALKHMKPRELASFSMKRPAGDVDVPSSCRPEVILVDKTK